MYLECCPHSSPGNTTWSHWEIQHSTSLLCQAMVAKLRLNSRCSVERFGEWLNRRSQFLYLETSFGGKPKLSGEVWNSVGGMLRLICSSTLANNSPSTTESYFLCGEGCNSYVIQLSLIGHKLNHCCIVSNRGLFLIKLSGIMTSSLWQCLASQVG